MDSGREIFDSGCDGLSRAQLMRKAAAAAMPGDGLPAVEKGMPSPAGTGLTRRSFVSGAAGLALAVYGAGKLGFGAFEEGIAQAAELTDQPILVSVYLEGGMDSMSVLAPTGDSRYRTLRPTLKQGEGDGSPFSEDHRLRWSPSVASLATLHAEGKVTVVPGVGYQSANQSHFTSRHFWEVGQLSTHENTGWIGRYLDQHGVADNPLQGLSLGWYLAPELATSAKPVATVADVGDYSFWAPGVSGPMADVMLSGIGELGAIGGGDSATRQAREAAVSTSDLRRQLAPFDKSFSTPKEATYPSGSDFASRLAGLAAMVGAGLPLRSVALNGAGTYDTHGDQAAILPNNLKVTCDSLLAFQRDLEARGVQDRVLTLVWSEFGRRAAQNENGTEHGAAGACFVIGTRASGQMIGEFPGLAKLDTNGNLRATTDYRDVYRGLLEQWLGVDSKPIIPAGVASQPPKLVT